LLNEVLYNDLKKFAQGLLAEGAQRIAITGVPPIGCLPVMITLNSPNAFLQRDCIQQFSSTSRDYNLLLQRELQAMQLQLKSSYSNAKIYYIDIYGPLANMIQSHQKYGL
jgi:phospholipase/lecithinase/hemolysin